MGKIADALGELIRKNINTSGIVVWFDPEKHYQKTLEGIKLEGAKLFIFNDSFFELKYELEPLLDQMDQPKVLVYVPKDRSETDNALIELEKAGGVLFPGNPSINQNTRLEVIARNVLRPIIPDSVEDICKQIASGSLNLADIEKIAEQGAEIGSGAIRLIFDSIDPVEIALRFMNEPERDDDIIAKNALSGIISIIHNSYGIEFPENINVSQAKERLKRFILLGDFLKNLPFDETPSELSSINIPEKESYRELASKLAKRWRDDVKYKGTYIADSETIEQEYKIRSLKISPEKLIESETFVSTEENLIDWAYEQVLIGKIDDLASLIERRKSSFWSSTKEALLMKWSIIESVVMLCLKAIEIKNSIKKKKLKPSEFINQYCDSKSEWFLLDSYHRQLEQRYERFDLEPSDEHTLIEKVVIKARQVYKDMVKELAESFQASCVSDDFEFDRILLQRDIFASEVKPLLGNGKLAYIWVDALRYEMAVELIAGFGEDFKVEMKQAIATLPTITEIGMASLLPDADREITIEESGKGKIGLNINGESISTRQDRINYLANKVSGFFETKIDAVLKPSNKIKKQISESTFILVTSQEIDEICEQENLTLAHRIMSDILNQIRRAIINLTQMDVENIILTSDHGFLFFEEIEPGEKIDSPGGKQMDIHQRVWIGNGGSASKSYIRLNESDVGLSGSCELAFPTGIGCIKAKGPDNPYFHGGISLQEMVIPLIRIKKKTTKVSRKISEDFELSMEKPKITTRFFTVSVKTPAQQQLIPDSKDHRRVQLLARSGGKEVGIAVQAVYGYEDGTNDIVLEMNRPNNVTMIITEEDISQKSISIHLLDAETLVELTRIENVTVDIKI